MLRASELTDLVHRVFAPTEEDTALAVLVDLPDEERSDDAGWSDRRALAFEWARHLDSGKKALGLEQVDLILYRNTHTNNGDFPDRAWLLDAAGLAADDDPPASVDELDEGAALPMDEALAAHSILLAPTEFSATAPLKRAAPRLGFRAASMPGFSRAMIPALALDWQAVDRRCRRLKELLDGAEGARFRFRTVAGTEADYELFLDLRHRTGHASGGLIQEPGTAGNLPSGETYVVPYEGEIDGDPSRSEGLLPVQLDAADPEVVIYRIEENRAVEIVSGGARSNEEAERLRRSPAYGNVAELGLGVLAEWGVEPAGEVLLDEKLGLHIAFGRSDHFGGQVGPDDFPSPDDVVHIDRVYLPATQPRVRVEAVDLELDDGSTMELMRDGEYVLRWDEPRV